MSLRNRHFDGARRLLLVVVVLLCSMVLLMLPKTVKAVGTYNNALLADKALGYVGGSGTVACSDAGKTGGDQCKQFVNCIVYMVSNHSQWPVDPNGNYQNSYSDVGGTEITSADSVKKGDIIQVGDSDTSNPLHTSIVVANKGSGKFNVVDANWNYDGMVTQHDYTPSGARFWRLGTITNTPTIIALKSSVSPDGAIETFMATSTNVTLGWYVNGGDGPHTLPIIGKTNIVGMDKLNVDNTELVYVAVSDGVWEASRVNGSTTVAQSEPVTGLSGVKGVIAENTFDGNGYRVHHLYILASDGPYEAYWSDADPSHTVHVGRLVALSGGIAFTHSIGPDGSEQLYVAVPTWVYEVSWFPGGTINSRTVINIPQGDIRSVDKGANLSDGGQLLYTTTSTTVWQTYWPTGGGFSNGTIATGQTNAIQGLKSVTPDGWHHVYLAEPDHVQEYKWLGSGSGGGEIIRISQGNIKAIAQQLDGSNQLLFTAAGSSVWETWWNGSTGYNTPPGSLYTVTV